MITREEVLQTAKKIITDNVPDMFGSELDENTVLNVQTNVDSMGFILVLTKLEGTFGVTIPDDRWNDISTLGDLADMVMQYLPKEA
ncbi:MAG: acyl carrier protein [Solobacterium sp.]|nr:acyl carrier protein [Solobacterium sp.]